MVRRGRVRPCGNAPAVRQLPWRQVENPHGTLPVLDVEGVETIHQASLRVLEELGIEVWSETARNLFADAGAIVEGEVVRVGREVIEAALATAPGTFTMTSRNPAKALDIGGNRIAFGLVAGPPSVHDEVRGRRSSNMDDYENLVRLAHYFNAIHILGNQVAAPLELPTNNRHLDTYNANLSLSDLAFHCTAIGRGRALDGINMAAIARDISLDDLEQLAASPGVTTIVNVNSPRRFDEEMVNGLMTMSEHGQPVSVTPFTLMGAMSPTTLGAGLTQQNAEALFGVTLTQLTRTGAPVLYGAFTSNVDMRSGAPAFGTPEHAKANVASGQLARLARQIPYTAAMRLILGGEPITAGDALHCGLVTETVAAGEVRGRAREVARSVALGAPIALAKAKEAVIRSNGLPLEEAYRIENECSRAVMATEDAREGPRAFMEKRPPEFKGR
ncbi:MAG: trimethylamine methyltransferase family protein [Actinobacteria bacterium]|nr:trimethylamine methyltransferase family protein [Actinomycetota bacterium]